jgi:hypothetical protein
MWPLLAALAVVAAVGGQFLVGYGVVGPGRGHRAFRRIHVVLAVATGTAFLAHDAVPLLWLERPALLLQDLTVLPAGLLVWAIFGAVVVLGIRTRHSGDRRLHVALAWAVVTIGLLHALAVVGGVGTTAMKPPCTSCHRPPAAHPSISCEACHTHPGIAW